MREISLIWSGLRKGNRVRSSHGFGLVRSDTLTEKLIEHFRARLRTRAERDGGPRSDHARLLLPLAEMLKIRHRVPGRRESFARTDLRLRCGLQAAGWQQDQNNRQPECHSHDEPHYSALFPAT